MWIFYRIKYFVENFLYGIKRFIQRGKRGYSDYDIFDMSYWFVEVIVPMLKQLKETKHSYPCNMTEEEWDNQLDKMIKCFIEMSEDGCSMKNEYKDKLFGSIEWNEFVENINKDETEEYKELREKWINREEEIWNYREKMKKEAFDLFSKHFWNLWD